MLRNKQEYDGNEGPKEVMWVFNKEGKFVISDSLFVENNNKQEYKTYDIMKRLFLIASVIMLSVVAYPQHREGTTIHNSNAGGLCQVLSQEQIDTCTKVILTGKLNSEDLRLLRRMAGYKEHDGEKVGKLFYLDLSEVRFISDKKPYLSVDAEKAHLCLYQNDVFTNPQERFSTPTVRGGIYGSHNATDTHVLGTTWGYKKNFALLNLDDTAEVGAHIFYRMTSNEEKGTRFKNLRHIKGHHLENVNGEWIWSSYIRKGQFCYDMFYGCPNLKVVILPKSTDCCNSVWVYKDEIEYYTKYNKDGEEYLVAHGR